MIKKFEDVVLRAKWRVKYKFYRHMARGYGYWMACRNAPKWLRKAANENVGLCAWKAACYATALKMTKEDWAAIEDSFRKSGVEVKLR